MFARTALRAPSTARPLARARRGAARSDAGGASRVVAPRLAKTPLPRTLSLSARCVRARRIVRAGSAASDDVSADDDKYELAASLLRARRAQDDAMELVLREMGAMSREVRALRREIDALKAGAPTPMPTPTAPAPATATAPATAPAAADDEADVRRMLDALLPSDGKPAAAAAASSPPPDDAAASPAVVVVDDQEIPVVLDPTSWRGDGVDRSREWPTCKMGEDDIFLMATIQARLDFLTLVPMRPRRRGERRSLRTFSPGASLRPPLAFDPDTPRRLSTPLLTPMNLTPTFARFRRR